MGKTPQDRCHDVLLELPRCFGTRSQIADLHSKGLFMELELVQEELVSKTSSLLTSLTLCWQEFKCSTGSQYDYSRFSDMSGFLGKPNDWIVTSTNEALPLEVSTATVISTYNCAVIITSSIMKDVDTTQSLIHSQRIAVHCQSILEAVRWHHNAGSESGGDITVVFALRIVYHCTPVRRQKEQAEEELAKWGAARGVVGISQLSSQDLKSKPPYNWDQPRAPNLRPRPATSATRITEFSWER